MEDQKEEIKLPPKYKVVKNSKSGYDYFNEKNEIIINGLTDNRMMRMWVWAIHNKIEGK